MLDKAVSAAYTFLVKNPDHERVLEGLTFYMKQPGYKEEMLVDELRSEYEVGKFVVFQSKKCLFDDF